MTGIIGSHPYQEPTDDGRVRVDKRFCVVKKETFKSDASS